MKNKSKKPVQKKARKPTLFDRLPKNEGEWLEQAIKFTLRYINNPPVTSIDKDMLAQAERLKQKLENWRKNEGKN